MSDKQNQEARAVARPAEVPRVQLTDQSGPCVAWRVATRESCILENDHHGPHVFPSMRTCCATPAGCDLRCTKDGR